MAGTSWDKLGQMDAAFEIVAPAIRRVAESERVKLIEFHLDDPIWRLHFARAAGGEGMVDTTWQEDRPEAYAIIASWVLDDYDTTMRRLRREQVGEFSREQPLERLEEILREALARVDGWTEADLDPPSGPHPDWQKYQSREDFYRSRLPVR